MEIAIEDVAPPELWTFFHRHPRAEARGYRYAAAPQPITNLSCRGQPTTIESSTDNRLQQLLFVGPASCVDGFYISRPSSFQLCRRAIA
ncbi:MAG: hypothetical protein ACK526_19850 [Planctomyces sp.]